MGKKILVAGGAGYVGSALVPVLLSREHDVTVWDLLWFGNHLPPGTKLERRNFFNAEPQDLEGFDTVIFLAGLSNDPMAGYSPKENYIANAAGPGFLSYIAKQAGVQRFIHGGTCSVYGSMPNIEADERTPVQSKFPYGVSKMQGEIGCALQADESFKVLMFRKGTICGHSPRMRFDLIINTMFKDAVTTGTINVNDSQIWRPILGIEDAVQAYVRGIEFVWGELMPAIVMNVASSNKQVGHVAQLVKQCVKEMLGIDAEIKVAGRKDNRDYRVSVSAAHKILGYSAQCSVEMIVRGMVENLVGYGRLDKAGYYNIETLHLMGKGAQVAAGVN